MRGGVRLRGRPGRPPRAEGLPHNACKHVGMVMIAVVAMAGCGKKEEKEAEAVVPVQVTEARVDAIRRIVEADGILYPRNQASVVPKISAPVRTFYVNRGDHVREGQLLALLENRDLAAAAEESKGQWNQAEANYRSTTAATVPEEVVKAQTDAQANKEAMDAAQKVLESRQKLYKEGALARKLVDDAQVTYVQAHSQYEAAQQHLEALESVGKQEQIKAAAAQVDTAKAHYQGAEAQVSYSEIRSPISGVIADRGVYPGEMANAGAPLLTVMDVSRVVARANFPQGQAGYVKVGDAATVRQTDGGEELPGKVMVVSPAVRALDGAACEAGHLRHRHAGRDGHLSGEHHSGGGVSVDRFSAIVVGSTTAWRPSTRCW
jgi:HlyD family secretion protein